MVLGGSKSVMSINELSFVSVRPASCLDLLDLHHNLACQFIGVGYSRICVTLQCNRFVQSRGLIHQNVLGMRAKSGAYLHLVGTPLNTQDLAFKPLSL